MGGSIWYEKCQGRSDYISHHVDDFIIIGHNPTKYTTILKEGITITGGEESSEYLIVTFQIANDSKG